MQPWQRARETLAAAATRSEGSVGRILRGKRHFVVTSVGTLLELLALLPELLAELLSPAVSSVDRRGFAFGMIANETAKQ